MKWSNTISWAAMGVAFSGGLQAAVTTGHADGTGIVADASVLGGTVSLGVLPAASSVNVPAPDTDNDGSNLNVAGNTSVNVVGLALVDVNALSVTGVLTTSATSDVDGSTGSKSASGTATLTGANVGLGGTSYTIALIETSTPSVISITATTIQSTSTVSGDYGAFSPVGSTLLANFALSVNGGPAVGLGGLTLVGGGNLLLGTHFDAFGNILMPDLSINLGVLDGSLAGATLVLNQQSVTNNAGFASIDTTALSLDVTSLTVGPVTNGLTVNLDLSESSAQLAAVPEISTVSALLGSFCVLGLLRRRR
jgi:hypothetical protein